MGLAAPRHMGSSQSGMEPHDSRSGRRVLQHCVLQGSPSEWPLKGKWRGGGSPPSGWCPRVWEGCSRLPWKSDSRTPVRKLHLRHPASGAQMQTHPGTRFPPGPLQSRGPAPPSAPPAWDGSLFSPGTCLLGSTPSRPSPLCNQSPHTTSGSVWRGPQCPIRWAPGQSCQALWALAALHTPHSRSEHRWHPAPSLSVQHTSESCSVKTPQVLAQLQVPQWVAAPQLMVCGQRGGVAVSRARRDGGPQPCRGCGQEPVLWT